MLALLLLVLAADPSADTESTLSFDEPKPRVSIYAYPVSTIANGVRGLDAPVWGLFVPLGVRVRITPTTALDFEAMVAGIANRYAENRFVGWAVSFAAGPSWQLWRGLFVAAHARFSAYSPVSPMDGCQVCLDRGPLDLGPGVVRAFTAETDVGWEFHWGPLYFAPTIGVGAGYAFDYSDRNGSRLLSPFSSRTFGTTRNDGFVWTVNLSLARIGFSL